MNSARPLPLDPIQERLRQYANPNYALCRDDMIWVIEHMRNLVACTDDIVLREHPDRLLRDFRMFAELASRMIRGQAFIEDQSLLKQWIRDLQSAAPVSDLPKPS